MAYTLCKNGEQRENIPEIRKFQSRIHVTMQDLMLRNRVLTRESA